MKAIELLRLISNLNAEDLDKEIYFSYHSYDDYMTPEVISEPKVLETSVLLKTDWVTKGSK